MERKEIWLPSGDSVRIAPLDYDASLDWAKSHKISPETVEKAARVFREMFQKRKAVSRMRKADNLLQLIGHVKNS